MSEDKRKYLRSPLSLETIYFTEDSERMYFPGTITNKSNGGIGLRVNYRHALNDRIWLEGVATANQPRSATVRWVTSNGIDSNEYLMGVEFAGEDEVLL